MTDEILSADWINQLAHYDRIVIGLSGGLDSTVLTHALCQQPSLVAKLEAIHIHHGLSPHADAWQAHCQAFCQQRAIAFRSIAILCHQQANLEEAARLARYAAFAPFIQKNHCLLTAHHQDDQAETLLLHLFRGTGVKGLAGIRPAMAFSQGELLRPLLSCSRDALMAYALSHQLSWVQDESNLNVHFSRNFIRQELLPLVRRKWPAVSQNLQRTATLCQEAQTNLDDLAQLDYPDGFDAQQLSLQSLGQLSEARLANVLRYWLQAQQVRLPSKDLITRLIREVIAAEPDRVPEVRWGNVVVKRYRHQLYLYQYHHDLPTTHVIPSLTTEPLKGTLDLFGNSTAAASCFVDTVRESSCTSVYIPVLCSVSPRNTLSSASFRRGLLTPIFWSEFPQPLPLTDGRVLSVKPAAAGIVIHPADTLEVRFRAEGEKLVWHGQTKSLKKLLQAWGIPPWLRSQLPLLYVNEELAAVVGYAISDRLYHQQSTVTMPCYEFSCSKQVATDG